MKQKYTGNLIIGLLLSSVLLFSSFDDNNDFEISKNLDIYHTLFKELNLYYVDDIDAGKLVKTSIDKMLETLDPYTNYYPESKMEDYKFMTTGQYGGVGAVIKQEDDYVVITELYKNCPAHKSGLKVGDQITAISGVDTKGKNTEQISEMLKGQPGTSFEITIKRPGSEQPINKSIQREKIQIESVPYYGMVNDEIGYMILTSFTENSGNEVKNAFSQLRKMGAKKVIFDLRGNPGGLLIEAVKIANIFIGKGQEIVSTRGKYKKFDTYYTTNENPIDTAMPIALLVNRGSASASEIVSGAIQDLDRGIIVGQRTFGKGLVQSTHELSYNSKLKLTTAKYYIPSGRCIQALDYSHKNEDGSVGKVPDSLITEFKTRAGRSVFDGGGVLPDVQIEEKEYSDFLTALVAEDVLFDFATEFCLRHDSIASPRTFKLEEDEIEKLRTFIKQRDIKYQTETEAAIDNLEETAKNENYSEFISKEISAMRELLKTEKEKEFEKNKDEILEFLKLEIVTRYYFQAGAIESTLNDDEYMQKAVEILNDENAYKQLLSAPTTK